MELKSKRMQRSNMSMSQNMSELPDSPNFKAKNRQSKRNASQKVSQKKQSNEQKETIIETLKGKTKAFIAGGLILTGVVWYALQPPITDENHPNRENHVKYVSTQVELSDMDLDYKLMDQFKKGIIPPEYKNMPYYYKKRIDSGNVKFFSITVLDNLDEDGDVVKIKVNNMDLGDVLLTNAGSTISVPLSSSGNDTLSVIGVKDGVGGITVTFRTSKGDFYSKVMQPGEVFNIKCGVN